MTPKLKTSVPIAESDLIEDLTDLVHEYTFVDLPYKYKGDSPEFGIIDYAELRIKMKDRIVEEMRKVKP